MANKTYDMIAISPTKANAQQLTCFIAFIAAILMAIVLMIVAVSLPLMIDNATKEMCWISMALEAISAGMVFVAVWIKRNAL